MVRVKSRYLLCEVNVSESSDLLLLDDRAVAGAVRSAVARMHGDYGAALCSIRFSVKYLNVHNGMVFLRFPKSCFQFLWSALPFITNIESRGQQIPCFLNCLHVGGTIRTCQKFLIRYNTQQLQRILPKCKNAGNTEKDHVCQEILNCLPTRGTKPTYEGGSEFEEDERE
uniref:Ribonuclease P/MRP protein subunit POP5 n=1 Tax=Oryzias sinensis TaxID=183150 RepID=A0A8C7WRC6_9TELE